MVCRRDALRKIAPGYNPSAMLVPSHRPSSSLLTPTSSATVPQPGGEVKVKSDDPMDELVSKLEEMENRR